MCWGCWAVCGWDVCVYIFYAKLLVALYGRQLLVSPVSVCPVRTSTRFAVTTGCDCVPSYLPCVIYIPAPRFLSCPHSFLSFASFLAVLSCVRSQSFLSLIVPFLYSFLSPFLPHFLPSVPSLLPIPPPPPPITTRPSLQGTLPSVHL